MMRKCISFGVFIFFHRRAHMNRFFQLKENNTTAGIEIRAGLTTFFAMAYIIFVNPVFLSVTGMDADGAMIATCLGAAIGSLLCGLISNKPFAMASGMGMNAFFAYTLCLGYGYTWQQALGLVFLSGILFFIVVLIFGENVSRMIPANLKYSITVGIGFLITLIGLIDGGIINVASGVPALSDIHTASVLIPLAGLVITVILTVMNVSGSLILGMLATVILSLVCGQSAVPSQIVMMPTALSKVFMKLDLAGLLPAGSSARSVVSLIAVVLTMTIIDMFDTLGYLVGTASRAGMIDEDGNVSGLKKVMLSDAAATILGSLCGTSTVTTYAESTSGIIAGGRTGLTAITTAVCFLTAMMFSPLAGMMSASVTAPALIVVGMYLMMDIRKVRLDDMADTIPAFLTIVAIPMTYSITAGIGIGFLAHVICTAATEKKKDLTGGTIAMAVIFLTYFIIG